MANSPRNSYRSAAQPIVRGSSIQPPDPQFERPTSRMPDRNPDRMSVRPSSQMLAPQFERPSSRAPGPQFEERPSSQVPGPQFDRQSSRSSSQVSGPQLDRSSSRYEPPHAPAPAQHGSGSSMRRSNTVGHPPSKNPFARLVAAGELPSRYDPFSPEEESHGLHRSNAVHHSRPDSGRSGSAGPSQPTGPTYSHTSTPRGQTATLEVPKPASSSRRESRSHDSHSGALVPIYNNSTVVREMPSASSRFTSSQTRDLQSSSSLQRSHSSRDHARPSVSNHHVTLNVTNINVGSHNRGHHGHDDDPLAAFSEIDIGSSTALLSSDRRHRSGSHHQHHYHSSSHRSRQLHGISELVDDKHADEAARADARLKQARENLEAFEKKHNIRPYSEI